MYGELVPHVSFDVKLLEYFRISLALILKPLPALVRRLTRLLSGPSPPDFFIVFMRLELESGRYSDAGSSWIEVCLFWHSIFAKGWCLFCKV